MRPNRCSHHRIIAYPVNRRPLASTLSAGRTTAIRLTILYFKTIRGMVDQYFLVVIQFGTRRIWVSPCTANPTGELTTQQARNFDMFLQDENLPCTILQRDQDSKYVQAFDDAFTGEGRTIKKTPIKSPNLRAFVELVIQTLKHEVLNGFCVINERHLDHILKIGADGCNKRRGHSGRDHLAPVQDEEEPPIVDLAKHTTRLPQRAWWAFEVIPGRGVIRLPI